MEQLTDKIDRQSKLIDDYVRNNADLQLEIIRLEGRIRDLRTNIPKLTNAYNNAEDKQLLDNVLKENAELNIENLRLGRRLKWALDYTEKLETREEELHRKIEVLTEALSF